MAQKIQGWVRKKLMVFAYFNNDAYGFAIKDAIALKRLCSTL